MHHTEAVIPPNVTKNVSEEKGAANAASLPTCAHCFQRGTHLADCPFNPKKYK
ncbi:hypothetical protein M422DRAFT_25506 [Sphaerobolus stellatus SS14]|nr:hypothetical protein M422DRAFT_25506 [Sphaerobolus stellatus SS14]